MFLWFFFNLVDITPPFNQIEEDPFLFFKD